MPITMASTITPTDTTMSTDTRGTAAAPRSTRQRTAVRDELDRDDAFRSAQQVHADLVARGESIGLSTVYRTLATLAESGDVDVITRADGEAAYRACGRPHHHHLVCRECGTTHELQADDVESWARAVGRRHGFTDMTHTVEVFGTCRDCRA